MWKTLRRGKGVPGGGGKGGMADGEDGETIVHLTGNGKGGRNQELALAAAEGISGLRDAVPCSASAATDGPTDAAGGYCDAYTRDRLASMGIDIYRTLQDNNAYMALERADGLVKTGATGTNVNDVAVLLIKRGNLSPRRIPGSADSGLLPEAHDQPEEEGSRSVSCSM